MWEKREIPPRIGEKIKLQSRQKPLRIYRKSKVYKERYKLEILNERKKKMEDNKKCLYLYNKNMNKKQEKRNNPSCFGRNNSCFINFSRNKT